MKKSFKKLNLNKTTISNLSSGDLNHVVGGAKTNGCLPQTFTCANGPCGQVTKNCGTINCPSVWCTVKL